MTKDQIEYLRQRRAKMLRFLATANGEWAQSLEQDIQIINQQLKAEGAD